MKRIICMLLVLTTAVLGCACSAKNDESAATNADKSDRLTYYYTDLYWDDMVETIKRYNRWCADYSTEDMMINLVKFDDYDTMSERLNIEVMSGDGPDLFSNFMDLPFEKLMQNGAFYDLNKLIGNDSADDKLDLRDFNETVLDAGLVDGKRYFIPTFYHIDTIIGEKSVLEKFNMPTEQGFHITFENMEEVLDNYLEDPDGYNFLPKEDEAWGSGTDADTLIIKLINASVNFDTKETEFDGEFQEKLAVLMRLRELSNENFFSVGDDGEYTFSLTLFNDFLTSSNITWMERCYEESSDDIDGDGGNFYERISEPVLYTSFDKDDGTYAAGISLALFLNANTKKADKALGFIKYLLGEHLQELYSGAEEFSLYEGYDVLPVRTSAFKKGVETAYLITDDYRTVTGTKESLSPQTEALLNIAGKINSVSLYADLYYSYYDKNVVYPVLEDFLSGKTDMGKFVENLTAATKIYLDE